MNKYVIFLRAVNVGGSKSMKMDTFSKALVKSGFGNVKTYINSGNIVLHSDCSKEEIFDSVNRILLAEFGFSAEIIIKTGEELEKIIRSDPYAAKEDDFSKRIVVMASGKIKDTGNKPEFEENFYIIDDLIYIYYHNGAGRSKFTNSFIERNYKVVATSRNWNTLLKMMEMVHE